MPALSLGVDHIPEVLPDSLILPAHCRKIFKEKEIEKHHKFQGRAYHKTRNVDQSSFMGLGKGETASVIASAPVPVEID